MRILAVTPYYNPEGGGLERYAHSILSRLAGRGHDIRALAFTKRDPGESESGGVRLRRVRPLVRVGNAPLHPRFEALVREEIRNERPDVVVAHTPVPFPAEMAFRAAQRERVPFVATYHAGTLRGSSPALGVLAAIDRATFERRMLDGAARLIAVSPYVVTHALHRHQDRTTIVPPGVDAGTFSPDGPAPVANILFVGPLANSHRWKGVDVLWSAFQRLRRHVPEARLTLVGEGDRLATFAHAANRLHGAVRVLGRVEEQQLVKAYRDASVVVLPSTSDAESFGMVLAEANACARPVIGSRIGGIPDFVRHGTNGFLVRPGDPADLASKLLILLKDPDLAAVLGRQGRELVVREHNWDHLAQRTEEVLDAIHPDGSGPRLVAAPQAA